jgi:hypothetical protein
VNAAAWILAGGCILLGIGFIFALYQVLAAHHEARKYRKLAGMAGYSDRKPYPDH